MATQQKQNSVQVLKQAVSEMSKLSRENSKKDRIIEKLEERVTALREKLSGEKTQRNVTANKSAAKRGRPSRNTQEETPVRRGRPPKNAPTARRTHETEDDVSVAKRGRPSTKKAPIKSAKSGKNAATDPGFFI